MSLKNNNNHDWYSTSRTYNSNYEDDDDNDYNYCSFCLINFNKYNDVINNICQVCGRVNTKVTQDKQPTQQLTAVNAPITEMGQSTTTGTSMRINYSPLTSMDETKKAFYSGNTRASFKSFKEAQEYLNRISDMSNATLNAVRAQKYNITTYKSSKRDSDFILTDNDIRPYSYDDNEEESL